MKYLLMLLSILVVLSTGCTNSGIQGEITEAEKQLQVYKGEISRLEEEMSQAVDEKNVIKSKLESVEEELIALKHSIQESPEFDENTIKMMEFFNEYNGRILTSDFQPTEDVAILNTSEGLRIFPEENAPFFGNDEITFEPKQIKDSIVMVHYYYNGNFDSGWAFVTNNYFSSGYVRISELQPYSYDMSYEPSEQFLDFEIGTNIQFVYDLFGNDVELIKDRNGYGHVIRVNSDENEISWTIDFWYHPADDKISVISTSSEKYPLKSGFKVGDKAEEVFAYYDELYEKCEYFNSDTYRRYDIGDGCSLDFSIYDGYIVAIMINSGMSPYA